MNKAEYNKWRASGRNPEMFRHLGRRVRRGDGDRIGVAIGGRDYLVSRRCNQILAGAWPADDPPTAEEMTAFGTLIEKMKTAKENGLSNDAQAGEPREVDSLIRSKYNVKDI